MATILLGHILIKFFGPKYLINRSMKSLLGLGVPWKNYRSMSRESLGASALYFLSHSESLWKERTRVRMMRCTYPVKPELDSARYTPTTDPGTFLSLCLKRLLPEFQKKLFNIYLFIYWPCCTGCRILVPWPVIEPEPPAVEAQSTTGPPRNSPKVQN